MERAAGEKEGPASKKKGGDGGGGGGKESPICGCHPVRGSQLLALVIYPTDNPIYQRSIRTSLELEEEEEPQSWFSQRRVCVGQIITRSLSSYVSKLSASPCINP